MQNLLCLKTTPDTNPLALYECKGSKFLSFLYPLESQKPMPAHALAQETQTKSQEKLQINTSTQTPLLPTHQKIRQDSIAQLQEIHKRAVHFVWAFRILNEYEHILEGSSDDGEPKGSAGAPMLEVLRGENCINMLCICVRYFGGTKLGVGGLVRAYTKATKDAIYKAHDKALLKPYTEQKHIALHAKSSLYNKILHLAKSHNLTLFDKEFQADSMTLHLKGETANIENFLQEYSTL